MRSVAFVLLLAAAVDLPVPWLDRAGVALAGLAFAAVAIGPALPKIRRARPIPARMPAPQAAETPDETLVDLLAATRPYTLKATASS